MIPLKDELPGKTFPISTISLIAINIVIFFYQQLHLNYEFLRDTFALMPIKIFFFHDSRYYVTLITYMFLHANLLHLVSNMLYLWIFGNNVEDVLGHLGFIYFYLICGVGAGIVHSLINPTSTIPTVGASGAVSGILAAYMVLYPTAKIITLVPIFIFFEVIKVPAYVFIGLWFLLQFFYGFSSLAPESTVAGIAWFAHIGGFVVGIFILPIFLAFRRRGRRR
jgi:membrane associated rhomboid family serine protease